MMKNLLKIVLGLVLGSVLVGCDNSPSSETPADKKIIQAANHSVVQIKTNQGDIWVELYDDITPNTVANFIHYVEEDFYKDTVIHQVLPGFIIQAGSYDKEFQQKAVHAPISNEATIAPKHTRGTIAMMRGNHPDSATSEFFINLKDNALFDIHNGYAVFGRVIKGMEVLDKISKFDTCAQEPFYDDVPCDLVVIHKVIEMGTSS
ncbi:MAG: peptidylprolyl isomerase [Gammaproteobacteria bacterium]